MSKVDPRQISECLGLLKNSDPRLYEKLIRLVDQYAYELTVAVTEVPPEQVMEARGRAQAARKFLQMFAEAREPNRPTP